MNYRMISYILGFMMLIESAFMLPPAIIALADHEPCYKAFFITMAILIIFGILLTVKKPKNTLMYAPEGFVTVSASWLIMSLFGALPFYLSGAIPSYIDAFFETVSGFTTTGSTILNDIEALPNALLFWRSFTHWVGGMGVLVFMLAILPTISGRSMVIMRAESPGPSVGKLAPKMHTTAMILYGIYIFLTVIEFFLLLLGGMSVFDSFIHCFSTAGTGGFSNKNASIAFYDSYYLETVISVFMVLFGVNFNVFYFIMIGKLFTAFKSEELKWYISIILSSIVLITISIQDIYGSLFTAFRHATFQVSSIISTTGFITVDFNQWPQFAKCILLLLMFTGSCAGSTGGGLKISRIILIFKSFIREMKHQLNPRSVNNIYYDKKPVNSEVSKSVNLYLTAYCILIVISVFVVSIEGRSFETTLTAVITAINNVGPSMGELGPMDNFSSLTDLSKLTLTLDMLIGRLEIFPVLALFSPSVWRK